MIILLHNFFVSLPPSRSERATRGRQIHGSCIGIHTLSATDGPLKLFVSCDFSGGSGGEPPGNDTRVLLSYDASRWASRAAASVEVEVWVRLAGNCGQCQCVVFFGMFQRSLKHENRCIIHPNYWIQFRSIFYHNFFILRSTKILTTHNDAPLNKLS